MRVNFHVGKDTKRKTSVEPPVNEHTKCKDFQVICDVTAGAWGKKF